MAVAAAMAVLLKLKATEAMVVPAAPVGRRLPVSVVATPTPTVAAVVQAVMGRSQPEATAAPALQVVLVATVATVASAVAEARLPTDT